MKIEDEETKLYLVSLFFIFQLPKIEINNDIEVFLPDNHPTKTVSYTHLTLPTKRIV